MSKDIMSSEGNTGMTAKANKFGAWAGILYVIIVFAAWLPIAGYWPLHEPSSTAAEIVPFYQGSLFGLRFGMILIMWCAALFLFFASTVADYVASVEGRRGPLTNTTLLAGYGNAMLTFYPPMWWLTAAFRPETRPDELLYLLNDIGWLQFIGGLSMVMPMYLIVGICILNDKSEDPIFPRWFAFFSFWTFVLLLPDQVLFFLHDGPFAWDGLFAFWIPVTLFGIWFPMLSYFMLRKFSRVS